jgi:hypothetical protein
MPFLWQQVLGKALLHQRLQPLLHKEGIPVFLKAVLLRHAAHVVVGFPAKGCG